MKDQADAAARQRYERFCRVREELLVDYGYNTARAYWGDLDDIYRWAEEHCKNVLALTDKDRKQYVALLRRRKYSENTVRRRKTALRLLMNVDAHRPEKDAL